MVWVVTANSNDCRIYQFDRKPAKIALVKEINHPLNKHKKSDYLTSDKPGHYNAHLPGSGGSFAPHSDPKEVAIDDFSREIAHELNQGRNKNAYKNLIIITSAHMGGLLNKHLDKHVHDLVSHAIQKDVMPLAEHELLHFLENNI